MLPGTCSVLADLRLEGGAGTCKPPSVKPGPQVTPGLGVLYRFKLTAEFEVFFFPSFAPFGPKSGCDSLIVLEGDPGDGGVFDREDLRVVNVKLFGRLFASLDGAVLCVVPGRSTGAYWSTTFSTVRELLRLRKLVVFLKKPGLFSVCEGEDDSIGVSFCMLDLLLTRRVKVGSCCSSPCFGGFTTAVWIGTDRGAGLLRSMILVPAA